jgi:hypothetical protein
MLTDKNKRAMYKRVDEYAERGNWPAITNIIGGSPVTTCKTSLTQTTANRRRERSGN